jgi:hypothetical protein
MSFTLQLTLGVVIPAAVAVLATAVGVWRRWAWAGALGVAIGYIAGHLFIRGVPPFPPIEVEDWLPILAVVTSLAGVIDVSWTLPRFARRLIRLGLTVATVLLLARPMIANVWPTTAEAAAWIAGLVAAMVAVWSIVDGTVAREHGSIVPFVLGFTMAGLAVVQGLSSSLVLARMSGAAAITIAPLAFVARRWPNDRRVRGALPVVIVLFAGLIMAGFFYSEVSRGSALILALAPLSVALTRVGRRHWIGGLLAVVVGLAAVGAAVGIAVATATPEPSAEAY